MEKVTLRFCIFFIAFSMSIVFLHAQRTQVLKNDINTVIISTGGNSHALPVLRLGSSDQFELTFDQMSNEYHRYLYRIIHLDADFKKSTSLFENDWVETSAEWTVIDDYVESMNTITNYTHYRIRIPNNNVQPLLSGNYKLEVVLDEYGTLTPALNAYFFVVDSKVNTILDVTTNTDIDWNATHQQVQMSIDTRQLNIQVPEEEIRTIILQNHRWDNAIWSPKPDYINGTILEWRHQQSLIFDAGNEYRRFEILSTQYPGMGIDNIRWSGSEYMANLLTAKPRRNYINDQDRNGQIVIRTQDNNDAASQSEYVWVNFSLKMPELKDADIYICGDWTYDCFSPRYRLIYDEFSQAYLKSIFLKTGFYSYLYLTVPHSHNKGFTGPVEGNYFQTENEYTVLTYYRRVGDRYWQLVGLSEISYDKKLLNQ